MKALVVATLCVGPLVLGPAEAIGQAVAIVGGTVHPVSGPPIEDGVVLIRDGRIAAVGPAGSVAVPADARRVDASGKVVTPGLLDAATELGLVEVSSVGSTRHGSLDGGAIRTAFRASDGVNPRSTLLPIARSEGVTHAIAAPSGGVISGQGVALVLAGDSRRDVILRDPVAVYAGLGPDATDEAGESRGGVLLELREALDEAVEAREEREEAEPDDPPEIDRDVAPLVAVLDGEIPLVVRASAAVDIERALELREEYGFRLVIEGGEEAWILADRLAAAEVPVIVRALENRPTEFHRLGTRYDGPALLERAGVSVILSTRSAHRVGQLPHEAGNAVRYGMSWEGALRAVTLAPAEAFGLAGELGSLEPGKAAHVVVWTADPFEFSGWAERALIAGEEVGLGSRQRLLFERYRTLEPPR